MNCKIYVITDRAYQQVKEAGYESVHVSQASQSIEEKKKVLQYILEKTEEETEYIGICLFDTYFIDAGRLLRVAALADKLRDTDIFLPDGKINSCMDQYKDVVCLVKKSVLRDYYNEMLIKCSNEEAYIAIQKWLEKKSYIVGMAHTESFDTSRMTKMYELIKDLTKDILPSYKAGKGLRLGRIHPSVGLDGRMPIWICWWQGEDHAPDLVKKCIASIRKNIPESVADVHIITFENYQEYVAFSETIVKRFQEGALSLTHLSDVLRAQLLCRYGGLWVDATCFIWDDRFTQNLILYPFFTRKQGGERNELDIVSGRWATYFIKGPANFSLFGFWVEAFEAYWEKYDSLLNYFIFDYMTAVAYDELADVKFIMDAVPVNNSGAELLIHWCNEPFDERKLQVLISQNWLFKMTYKKELVEKTPQGEATFYHVVRTSM